MAISELEANMQIVDNLRRKYIVEQIELRKQLKEAYRVEKSVLKQSQYRDAIRMVNNNLQIMRVEGLL